MQYRFILTSFFLLLASCSSDNEIDLSNSVNVFENKNNFPFINKMERIDSKLDKAYNIKNIFNAKSYNIKNAGVDFPLNKIWELNTEQYLNDKNPFLPEPIFISSNLYLINNHGTLFKIDTTNGKVIWKKKIFEPLMGASWWNVH